MPGLGKTVHVWEAGADPTGQIDSSTVIRRVIEEVIAGGGGTVDFGGTDRVYRVDARLTLSGAANVTLAGEGATLASGAAGRVGTVVHIDGGSRDVMVLGLRIAGHHSARLPSTGSGPLIMIGGVNGSAAGHQRGITVADCVLSGGNWAAVMIYARQDDVGAPSNTEVVIRGNVITDSSNGVFVYKNAEDILIEHNSISQMGYDGIVIDTMAASDKFGSASVARVRILDNTVEGVGLAAHEASTVAIGILAKGMIRDLIIGANHVRHVGPGERPDAKAYGILVNPDAGRYSGRYITVVGNEVSAVKAGTRGASGIEIGPGWSGVIVERNTVSNVDGPLLELTGVWDAVVSGNRFADAGAGSKAGVRVTGGTAGGSPVGAVEFARNEVMTPAAEVGLEISDVNSFTLSESEIVGGVESVRVLGVPHFRQRGNTLSAARSGAAARMSGR